MSDYWTSGEGLIVLGWVIVVGAYALVNIGRALEYIRRSALDSHLKSKQEDEWSD